MSTTSHDEVTIRMHGERADAEVVDFNMLGLVIASVAGITAVTAMMYAGPAIWLPRIDAIRLLGTIFAAEHLAVPVLGGLLWVGVGLLFGVVYIGLWTHGVGRPTVWWGLLFGLIHGNLVMILMPLLISAHPLARGNVLTIEAGISVVLAHLVFGLVIALIYRQYLPPEQQR